MNIMSTRADRHPLWLALAELVRHRKHGWEASGGPGTRIGPRRRVKREALLVSTGAVTWEVAVAQLARALAVEPADLLRELTTVTISGSG